ncbi:MAG: hypothetical protein LBI13_02830, partial [Streptococcaceae bacterium]|nr:hypothetical protein [Streptococcaceae bacterium]
DTGKASAAWQILKGAKKLLFRKDCYASSLHTFGSGYYLYRTGKEKEGHSKMSDIIHFFGLIGDRITQVELQAVLNRIGNGKSALI